MSKKPDAYYTDKKDKIRPIFQSGEQKITFYRALKQHRLRKVHAQVIDEAMESEKTTDLNKWAKNPNKYDVEGIDLFTTPSLKSFDNNIKSLEFQIEQTYGGSLKDVEIVGTKTPQEFEEASGGNGESSNWLGFAKSDNGLKSIYFSPKTTKLIATGEIKNWSDFNKYETIVHELFHSIEKVPVANPSGSAFEEGANEILAYRYTLNHIQMDRKLREELRKIDNKGYDLPYTSYAEEVRMIAQVSLLVNDLDPEKSIKWIETVKFGNPKEPVVSRIIAKNDAELKLQTLGFDPRIFDLRVGSSSPEQRTIIKTINSDLNEEIINQIKQHPEKLNDEKIDLIINHGAGWFLLV